MEEQVKIDLQFGDVIYFKKCRKKPNTQNLEIQFKGFGIAMVLGEMPPNKKGLPQEHLMPMMGQAGFISFDDIGEFLGEDVLKTVIQKFEAKHSGEKLIQEPKKTIEDAQILDINGKTIN